jgi:hypothetical protein
MPRRSLLLPLMVACLLTACGGSRSSSSSAASSTTTSAASSATSDAGGGGTSSTTTRGPSGAVLHMTFEMHGAVEAVGTYDATTTLTPNCQTLATQGTAAQSGRVRFEVPFPDPSNGLPTRNVSPALQTPPIGATIIVENYRGPATYTAADLNHESSAPEIVVDPFGSERRFSGARDTATTNVTVNADGSGSATWAGYRNLNDQTTVNGKATWTC